MFTETKTLTNGILMPMFGLGTWQISNGEVYRVVLDALSLGYRAVDTAAAYHNEEGVGRAIRESGIARGDLFLTSKLAAETKGYQETIGAFERTMEALKTDYLDLYLIHAPWPWDDMDGDYTAQNLESWRAMEEIYRSGKVRAIGVSNFMPEHLKPLLDVCSVVPHVNQISYYAGHIQRTCDAFCNERGIFVESYAPLATGGVFKQPLVHMLAEKNRVTPAQLCIRYCLQKGHATISKSTHKERLAENAALSFVIPEEDMRALDALDPEQ